MRAVCFGLSAVWLLAAGIAPFLISTSLYAIIAGAMIGSTLGVIAWTLGWDNGDHAPPRVWLFSLKTAAVVLALIAAINALFCAYAGATELAESVRTALVFLGWSAFLGLNTVLLAKFVVWRPRRSIGKNSVEARA